VRDPLFSHTPGPPRRTTWEAALGLERASGLARMARAQSGLPVAAFDRFAKASGVSRAALARAIRVSLRTVQRRGEAGERLDPASSERLVRLADLYARAADVIGDDDLARQWMLTPRDVFEDRSPFELAGSELGAREVEDLLLRVEHGVHA
jgi:putative toxin-antitoxin system antitoxin component (TIGR02293 family)